MVALAAAASLVGVLYLTRRFADRRLWKIGGLGLTVPLLVLLVSGYLTASGTGDEVTTEACYRLEDGEYIQIPCPTPPPGATLPPGASREVDGHCFLIVEKAGLEMPCPTPFPTPLAILDWPVEGRCFLFTKGTYPEFPCGTATPFPLPE